MVKSIIVEKEVEPFIDTGNLLIVDREAHTFDSKKNGPPTEEEVKALSRDNVQLLFNDIWKLPRKTVSDAICAQLPAGKYDLPREKPIPQKAPPTRWEKFAQEKGIRHHRDRSKKIWDEQTQTWKPRYGYNRGNDSTKDWIVEIPDQKDPYVDYFQERNDQKKERVAKNQLQHMQNVKRNIQHSKRGRENPQYQERAFGRGSNAIPLGVTNEPMERTQKEIGYQMHRAKEATASGGKFQQKIKGEKTPNLGRKRKFDANEIPAKSERDKQFAILERMASKKSKIASGKINAAAESSKRGKAA